MLKYLLPVCIFLCLSVPVWGLQAAHEAETIAAAIAEEIQTGEPIFLDLRTGEWTASLTQNLSKILLAREADLRDNPNSLQNPEFAMEITEEGYKQINLKDYGINAAVLVQVNLNVKWQERIEKNFFSYRSTRHPIYSFETKQIHLPEQRLIKISAYDFSRTDSPEKEVSRLRLRWFEPLVATTAIGSMIFLLWNFG
jgi:hypothetical protein